MKLILTDSHNPYYNLACEEYYLRHSAEDVFMLWQNEPSVIIGKNQDMYTEVDVDFTESQGIHVARRITGGGAVYHDLGNVNYSFITSREKANVLDFAYFTAPVLKALASLGVKAALSGRNDLISELSGGATAKFSGNAQTATNDRILHHGTLLFDSDMTVLSKALKPDPEKLRTKAIQSVRSRVVNLRELVSGEMDTAAFFEFLKTFAEKEFGGFFETADRLSVLETGLYDRNKSADYNAGRKESYAFSRKKRFPGGTLMVLWNEEAGRISTVRIEGDFFGEKDTKELEALLMGAESTAEGLRAALSGISVADYVSTVENSDFVAFLTEAEA